MPHLVAVLNVVFSKAMGRHVEVENALVSYLREHRFVHGNARVAGRIVLFFYFEDADTGLLMLIPGIRGQMEVARFHLKGGLPDGGGIEDQPSLPMARKECMNIGTRPKLLQEVPSL
jgi:hypothetical protein